MKNTCLIILALACLHYAPAAPAWGWEGHKLICAMAETQLTPAAHAMVDRLMRDGDELKKGGRNFAESCLWADDVKYGTRRSTYEHHFINVPADAQTIDLARDCAALNCTVVGIQQALTYLARDIDGDRARLRRAAALRFLGHYIGDMHQPLHVGNAADWGGNRINVTINGEQTNLHALWDYKIPEKMGLAYPDSVDFLLTVESAAGESTDMVGWLNESLALARSHAYVDSAGNPIRPGAVIDRAYFERAKPVVIAQMALAASRLADLLNRIAAGEDIRVFALTSTGG